MALAMRSAPTSSGLRYLIRRPLRTPACSTNGSRSKYFWQAPRSENNASGTTEATPIRLIAAGSTPFSRNAARKNTPSSSLDARESEVLRNCSSNGASTPACG